MVLVEIATTVDIRWYRDRETDWVSAGFIFSKRDLSLEVCLSILFYVGREHAGVSTRCIPLFLEQVRGTLRSGSEALSGVFHYSCAQLDEARRSNAAARGAHVIPATRALHVSKISDDLGKTAENAKIAGFRSALPRYRSHGQGL